MSNKRDVIRHKRRLIREGRKISSELHYGSADNRIFGDGNEFRSALYGMDSALDRMDRATKPLA